MLVQLVFFHVICVGVRGLTAEERDAFSPSSCKVDKAVCGEAALSSIVSASIDDNGDLRITSNSVPDHATCFQCSQVSDSCYTPAGWISEILQEWIVPGSPEPVSSPDHVPPGTVIGIMKNGVPLHSACDINLEALDGCLGRPDESDNRYHYVVAPVCMRGWAAAFMNKSEMFLGVAVDGFPIYNPFDLTGNWVTNDVLDECHGYDPGNGYRYIANDEHPYVIGCLTGRNRTTEMSYSCRHDRAGAEDRQLGSSGRNCDWYNDWHSWYHDGNSGWYYDWWSPGGYSDWYNSWYDDWYNDWNSWYHDGNSGGYSYWSPGGYNDWYSDSCYYNDYNWFPSPTPTPATTSTTVPASVSHCIGVVEVSQHDTCGTNDLAGDSIYDRACWERGTDCFSTASCAVVLGPAQPLALVAGTRPLELAVVFVVSFGAAFGG